jgi:glycosyltransferase involved in cell wall biosynthesis
MVVSDPLTVRAFLSDQIRVLSQHFHVTVIMNHAADEEWRNAFPNVTFRKIQIVRRIEILADFKALWRLFSYFRQQNFDVVHSFTPKAGLLSMVAARFAKVPNRLHTFTGQVWATRRGAGRFFFKSIDYFMVKLASEILVDSFSQRDFLFSESVLRPGQGTVLGHGSISGVDIEKFKISPAVRSRVRTDLGITDDCLVFLYLGRLNRDKGILDLAEAYRLFRLAGGEGVLLIVGPDEADLKSSILAISGCFAEQVSFVGRTKVPQDYMAAADVFCLPSYREGFGSVIIEAASCGIPAIGSRIYGITDAVVSNDTGLLHEPRNAEQLSACMQKLARDEELRTAMGVKAYNRSRTFFAKGILSKALLGYYQKILALPLTGNRKQ